MNQATGSVTPEQCPLGAFKNFHAVHVKTGKQVRLPCGLVGPVNVDGIWGLGQVEKIILGGTADAELLCAASVISRYMHAGSKGG